jgi:hypothetical protein
MKQRMGVFITEFILTIERNVDDDGKSRVRGLDPFDFGLLKRRATREYRINLPQGRFSFQDRISARPEWSETAVTRCELPGQSFQGLYMVRRVWINV